MSSWLSRMFRSRGDTAAARAEVEGRFEDAARFHVDAGARPEAFRVLMRASECATSLVERRRWVSRALAVAPDDEMHNAARHALASITLAESEATPPQHDDERMRLAEAAHVLEEAGDYRDAARAFRLLGDREGVERALMLSGDVEEYEREAGAEHDAVRYRLRRRNAIETFEMLWRGGERRAAIDALGRWSLEHADDTEARLLFEERKGRVLGGAAFEAVLNDVPHIVIGRFPVTFGREGDVVVRGASVSREHCTVAHGAEGLAVRDLQSRNGTQVDGVPIGGVMPLAAGQRVSLGADLVLRVEAIDAAHAELSIERGMDRGLRVVLVFTGWASAVGMVRFRDGGAWIEPREALEISGTRVVVPVMLARGDRVVAHGATLEVPR